jgi:hypothetical protein
MLFADKWMEWEIMLSNVNQDQKEKGHIFPSYVEDRFKI